MARIRTIKPEFWQDHSLAKELTRDQRLLYIGLWNEADDEGRFLANPRRLLGNLFPFDEDIHGGFIEASLRLLADTGRVLLYEVDGTPYGQLTKFSEHQRINRPTPSRIPPPPNDLRPLTEYSLSDHGGLTEASMPGTGEVGTGEVGTGEKPPREAVEVSTPEEADPDEGDPPPDSGWIHPTGRMSGSQILHAWENHTGVRIPTGQRRRHQDIARRIADRHTTEEVQRAMVGMTKLFPHAPPRSEPWDLGDLDRKFAKALAAFEGQPERRAARELDRFLAGGAA